MASSQGMQLQLQPIIMMLVLVQVVVVILSLSAATIAAPPTEAYLKNLGCMNGCGNLNIPYPFGVNENCYLSKDFFINCSHSQPYLRHGNLHVTNISLEGELRVMQFIATDCYDSTGNLLPSSVDASLRTANFSVSSTKNKFTVIGCDTYAYLEIYKNGSFVFATGCDSTCTSIDYIPNDGSCSGIGCCQTSIPKQLNHINIAAHSFWNHKNVSHFNPCSYAFVVEESKFNFSTTYLQDFKENKVPLVLDWGIGDNETCDEAKRNLTSYACGDHSDCYEAEIGNGYICNCSKGYEGNAYLLDGCKDIDECADPNLNQCVEESKCLNTPGNYTCSCAKRYNGDGKTDGTRCTAGRVLVLQIVIGNAIYVKSKINKVQQLIHIINEFGRIYL